MHYTYATAAQALAGRTTRKLEYATYLEERDEHTIAVRQHGTDIVTYHDDHTITLANGGFFSKTTKERLERYAPVVIRGPLERNLGRGPSFQPGMFSQEPREGGPWTVWPTGGSLPIEWEENLRIDEAGRPVDFTSELSR